MHPPRRKSINPKANTQVCPYKFTPVSPAEMSRIHLDFSIHSMRETSRHSAYWSQRIRPVCPPLSAPTKQIGITKKDDFIEHLDLPGAGRVIGSNWSSIYPDLTIESILISFGNKKLFPIEPPGKTGLHIRRRHTAVFELIFPNPKVVCLPMCTSRQNSSTGK